MWISLWGGYNPEKEERLKYGGTEEFETNINGFLLSVRNIIAALMMSA